MIKYHKTIYIIYEAHLGRGESIIFYFFMSSLINWWWPSETLHWEGFCSLKIVEAWRILKFKGKEHCDYLHHLPEHYRYIWLQMHLITIRHPLRDLNEIQVTRPKNESISNSALKAFYLINLNNRIVCCHLFCVTGSLCFFLQLPHTLIPIFYTLYKRQQTGGHDCETCIFQPSQCFWEVGICFQHLKRETLYLE